MSFHRFHMNKWSHQCVSQCVASGCTCTWNIFHTGGMTSFRCQDYIHQSMLRSLFLDYLHLQCSLHFPHSHLMVNQIKSNQIYCTLRRYTSKSSGCLGKQNSRAAVQWPKPPEPVVTESKIAKLLPRSRLANSQECLVEQSAVLQSMWLSHVFLHQIFLALSVSRKHTCLGGSV